MVSELIIDETPLTEPYVPERLLHREGVIKEVASSLKPVMKNRSADNLLIYGDSGTGKTTVIKHLLESEFKDSSVYINCWNVKTRHKILSEILLKLNQVVHGRESTDELARKFEKLTNRRTIVCLDEADQLKDTSVLYNLARSNSAVTLVANNEYFLASIDPRITSGLWLKRVRFKKYTANELVDILKERVTYALKPNVVNNAVLRIIALIADGDARIALQTLHNAAKTSERKNLDVITIDEAKESVKQAKLSKRSYQLSKLSVHERTLYDILERNGKMKSGELYNGYCKLVDYPLQDRAYRANMERLVERGLVVAQGDGKGRMYLVNP
ncbi:MAG: AAA family ATPase [Thaumarchaeota archaeon]|nr:AAA family ATPase [Nitrososphaerota archaeon]